MNASAHAQRPLSAAGQQPRRQLEQVLRRDAVATVRWARQSLPAGTAPGHVAAKIGLAYSTLTCWRRQWRFQPRQILGRGRPCRDLSPATTLHVQELLQEHGPVFGLPALKGYFPAVPRTALRTIRDQYCRAHAPHLEHLTWTQPGAVWAADFTQTPMPIDGGFDHILLARDLAAYYQLLALPAVTTAAYVTVDALEALFTLHGAPLLLKVDNGLHCERLRRLLACWQVMPLVSPPYTARYNGSCEAGIGSLKTRVHYLACGLGHPANWNSDIVEAARLGSNAFNRPWGTNGLSPDQSWAGRVPVSPEQRRRFLDTVPQFKIEEQEKLLAQSRQVGTGPLNAPELAIVARRAIRRALIQLGFLLVTRRANLSTN